MTDVLYFGARLSPSLAQSSLATGHTILHLPHSQGLQELQRGKPSCGAVAIQWRSKRDQHVIDEAKALDIPVLVITSKLTASVKTAEPFAEIYLEEPVSDDEVVAFILDMMAAQPVKRTVAAVAGVGATPTSH